jgi:hypothetical protein
MSQSDDQVDKTPLPFDDIIQRMATLNTSTLFDSYIKLIAENNQYVKELNMSQKPALNEANSCSKEANLASYTRNNWTVAPKLLPSNTTACKQRTIHSGSLVNGINVFGDDSKYKTLESWNGKKTSEYLRPIGTKPQSMYTTNQRFNGPNNTSGSNSRYFSTKYAKTSINHATKPNVSLHKSNDPAKINDEKNIWHMHSTNEKSHSGFASPFSSLHYSAKSLSHLDEFNNSIENLKNRNKILNNNHFVNTSNCYNNTNNYNNNKIGLSSYASGSNGRYSVAPINYARSHTISSPPVGSNVYSSNGSRMYRNSESSQSRDEYAGTGNRPPKTVYSISKMDSSSFYSKPNRNVNGAIDSGSSSVYFYNNNNNINNDYCGPVNDRYFANGKSRFTVNNYRYTKSNNSQHLSQRF